MRAEKVQCYTYNIPGENGGSITWNIEEATNIVNQGRFIAEEEISPEEMRRISETQDHLQENEIKEADYSKPGIGAPIVIQTDTERMITYVLIDGNKRCVKAVREGATFSARLLRDDDSRACVIFCTNTDLIP